MPFKERLKQAAKDAGLTQVDVAARMKVSQPSVNAWFRGRSLPDIGRITELAEILRVDVQWLLDGSTRKPSREPDLTGQDEIRRPTLSSVNDKGGLVVNSPMARTAYNLLMRMSHADALYVIERVVAQISETSDESDRGKPNDKDD